MVVLLLWFLLKSNYSLFIILPTDYHWLLRFYGESGILVKFVLIELAQLKPHLSFSPRSNFGTWPQANA
jgi:hypothetical protein